MTPLRHIIRVIVLWIILIGIAIPTMTQSSIAQPEAGFSAFRCNFDPTTNSGQIRAMLIGADGRPMPTENYVVNVSVAGNDEILNRELVKTTSLVEREPLQMIVVLDITNTVPITEIVNAFSTQLVPELDVNDEVALITFGADISPVTQFYIDKNRLINENMIDLRVQDGDNRIYDAVLDAISVTTSNSTTRQVILLITDSGRRGEDQTEIATIIQRATENDVQVYTVGFYSRDIPDEAEFRQIANATNGYSWILADEENTRASIEAGLSDLFGEFAHALNSEVLIEVDMQDLEPDANGRVLFDIVIDTENDSELRDQISCPLEILNHSITFVDRPYPDVITDTEQIEVDVESDMTLDDTQVAFWVNDEIVQTSSSTSFNFDAASAQPGINRIGAQLRTMDGDILATTPTTINLFAQQQIKLNIAENSEGDLSGRVVFEVETNPEANLPNVQFRINVTDNPSVAYPIGDGAARVEDDGSAQLAVNGLRAEIERLFPNLEEGDTLEIRAFVPGNSPQSANWAESNVLIVDYVVPSATTFEAAGFNVPGEPYLLPGSLTVLLFLFNMYLARQVTRARIRRLINIPDNYELDNQLMAVTVRSAGTRQTHVLTKKTVFLGRGSSNDINLGDDPNISRQHGAIIWRKEKWYYTNRKPKAKVRVNGRRARGYRLFELYPVTEIDIGDAQIVFHSNSQQDLSEFIKTNL